MENLSLNEYQQATKTTAIYPIVEHRGNPLPVYPVLGLVGEAGEIAEKIKKIIRDKDGRPSESDLLLLKAELGDVLWYISQISSDLGYNLESVARDNLDKLRDRKDRGKLGGSGDTR